MNSQPDSVVSRPVLWTQFGPTDISSVLAASRRQDVIQKGLVTQAQAEQYFRESVVLHDLILHV